MSSGSNEAPFPVRKRAVTINGKHSSVSLEQPFWDHFKAMARRQGKPAAALVDEFARDRRGVSLSSTLRLAVLDDLKAQIPVAP